MKLWIQLLSEVLLSLTDFFPFCKGCLAKVWLLWIFKSRLVGWQWMAGVIRSSLDLGLDKDWIFPWRLLHCLQTKSLFPETASAIHQGFKNLCKQTRPLHSVARSTIIIADREIRWFRWRDRTSSMICLVAAANLWNFASDFYNKCNNINIAT